MKTSSRFHRTGRGLAAGLLLTAFTASFLAGGQRAAAVAAGAFVEPLQFITVDTRADNSAGTPKSGITYVLGRDDSNNGILRKYDAGGGELVFNNGAVQMTLTNITPTALAVDPGTTNLYVVGGSTIFRVDTETGRKVWGVTNTTSVGTLFLQSVQVVGGQLFLCGNFSGTSNTPVFGSTKNLVPRGQQAAAVFTLGVTNLLGNTAPTVLGALTFGNTGSGSVNKANSIVVDDNGDIYVGGHLDTGTFASDVFTAGNFSVTTKISGSIGDLSSALSVLGNSGIGSFPSSASSTALLGLGAYSVARVNGLVDLAVSELYTFSTLQDDGGQLKIDGKSPALLYINNDLNPQTASIPLSAGLHSIEWIFYNIGGPGYGGLNIAGGNFPGPTPVPSATFAAHSNKGYVMKFNSSLTQLLNTYFTAYTAGSGGDITELSYVQGWIYATGFWQGNADNPAVGSVDRSVATSKDVDILKLDTGLQLKARATVKGVKDNSGFSVTADDSGNAYVCGSFGDQSASFFGNGDATNHPFALRSSAKPSIFVAQLDSNFAYKWITTPSGTQPDFNFPTTPKVRWNSALQRVFWTGYFNNGSLSLGNTNAVQILNGPEGFIAVLDPDGRFTERVNLTVLSDYGVSGTQVRPFGGPALNTNSVITAQNTKPRIKGAQITVTVPSAIYRDLTNGDITLLAVQDNSKIDTDAETRISCTGYSVGENVANGIANSYTFTLNQDTVVRFNWLVEYALRVKANFDQTAGADATNTLGHINGLKSEAAGTPVPAVQKHWIKKDEPVIATIDSYVDDPDYLAQGLPVRYVVTGYDAFGPPNTQTTSNATTYIPFLGRDIRQQVPQFLMTGPGKVTYKWKLKIGVQIATTGLKSSGYPLVKLVSGPGQVPVTNVADGLGVGTYYFDENSNIKIGTIKNVTTNQLKGWFNGDGTVFTTTGTLADAADEFTAVTTNGGLRATNLYAGKNVVQLTRPARVMWDYGDRIFEETVFIGNTVTFVPVLADTNVYASLQRTAAPDHVDVITAPSGSTGNDMGAWDPIGKKYYPVRPGSAYAYWLTTGSTNDRVILKLNFKYPVVSHYRHIAGTPGVLLDPSTNDFVTFKAMKYSEATTGAAVDDSTKRFTTTGSGKSVLLFGELSSTAHSSQVETYRVRVVESKLWTDQLPATQPAIIGKKITSPYDTAGLGTGSLLFTNVRYNAEIYDREAVSGPIIPVNLFPTAGPAQQFVVTWYEQRDQILWPYQPVRYNPVWPTAADGLSRIVIASRYGSESVAQDGSDQVIVPEETYGTNVYPAESALNPTRFSSIKIYNQPNPNLSGFNPNEEHALLAPSLRSAAVSPRPMAAYALRTGDLNTTNRDASYTSDPYVLVQFYDNVAQEARMKVFNIVRAATNLDVGDLSYRYSFSQEMAAGEPVIPFYPLPQVIGATPCSGNYGKDGQPTVQRCYWKDHKGTAWAVSGNSYFFGYYFYPLLPDFWWPTADNKQPGDCVAFLPDTARYSASAFTNINYTLNNQTPPAQGIYYSTVWPDNVATLKVGETLTFPGGEYRLDNPTTTVTTDDGDVITQETEGLPGVLAFAAGEIVFDHLNPVMNDQDAFTKYTARLYPALEERTVSLPVTSLPAALNPANRRTTVKNGVYIFNQLPSSLQKRMFYDPLRAKLGIKGFLNDKSISDPALTATPPAVYCLEPSILTLAERNILNGTDPKSPFTDLAGTAFATAVNDLYNYTRNPNQLDLGNNGADTDYRVGLEQKIKVTASTGVPQTVTDSSGITSFSRDKTKAAPQQALGPGLALTANPNFLNPTNAVAISYLTLAENNSDALGSAPVALHIIKVDKTQRYRGAIKTILSDNVFDENIILRHTGDFGGNADDLVFEWWYRPEDGTEARVPDREPAPWKLFADPSGNAGRGFYQLTLKGNPSAPEALIADSLFYLRYRHKDEIHSGVNWEVPQNPVERRCLLGNCIPGIPYDWAGAGNSSILDVDGDGEPDYRPQLAEGWIKRVLARINPYEARINDFSSDSPATYSSLIQQLGAAYTGPVALNPDKNVIENVGLIALYETIFKRGRDLSIDLSTPISTPSIANALQLASTRLSDFYRLLGNEAASDAQDPTIGFGSESVEYGSLAPTIFAFQNQMASLLEQELALLRGVDTFNGAPVNNRLYWNFTHAEGEAAYALKYNLSDITRDGFIDVNDAMTLYPQGHGDAWGHFLSAQTFQYDLLRHPYFNWVSRSEYINSQDVVIRVDYLDERKFAQTAASKAQAGAEIVTMTYREKYVADPQGQWQGYHDTDVNRSWGVEEWARRVGQSTYFDWITANALLPAQHPNTNYTGVQKVDRTTVQDIALLTANLTAVQSTMEQVNGGNNPLGLSDGALPFAFDPNFLIVGSGIQGQKFFDQTYSKAVGALNNAKVTFDNANQLGNMIRQIANSETEFRQSVFEQDLAYRNRLIELFGTPYEGTIGSGKIYPAGYQGPDTMLYMYVAVNNVNNSTLPRPPTAYYTDRTSELTTNSFINGLAGITGVPNNWKTRYKITFLDQANFTNSANFTDFSTTNTNPLVATLDNLNLPIMANGYTYVAPSTWGIRTSPGELQSLVSQMVQAQADVNLAISDWNDQVQDLKLSTSQVQVKYENYKYQYGSQAGQIALDTVLDAVKLALNVVGRVADFSVEAIKDLEIGVKDMIPTDLPTAGLAFSPGDALAPVKGATQVAAGVGLAALRSVKLTTDSVVEGTDVAKSLADAIFEIERYRHEQGSELIQALQEIQKTARAEATARIDVFAKVQALRDLSDQYRAKLGEGVRLIEERTAFNKRVAAQTQQNRYQDVAFRYSRNAALEKYRSAFDLAARYVFLAARAYDFDLNLSRHDPASPVDILADIVRQRTLGLISDLPQSGAGGLAEDLARLKANYDVTSARMGLNNPQYELTTFSLRSEAFRIDPATNSDGDWQSLLSSAAIHKADLWQVPEFRRYCRPFASETAGAQPGLVIELNTSIMPGQNFFGFPLGAGDHAYDPSVYSTRIHGVSVTFDGYDGGTLSASPRAYLIPAGSDVMTIADSPDREMRAWNVVDQNIPVPYPATSANLGNQSWRPFIDSVTSANGSLGDVRRFSSFLATSDSVDGLGFNAVQDLRLIGRSVWNTKWLLIIPGASLHNNPVTGLDGFINSVTDIKLTIDSYGYSGN